MPDKPDFTLITYSPTGNAAYLADVLAKQLDYQPVATLALDKTAAAEVPASEHLVLLFPIHAFNAPWVVKQFVEDLPAGLSEFVSLIAVGSADMWMNYAASLEVRRLLESKGYTVVVDEVLAMPVTIVMKLGDDEIREMVAETKQKLSGISTALQQGTKTVRTVPVKAKLIQAMGKMEPVAARLFGLELHANDACISCGTCWDNCPANNIQRGENGKPKFAFSCTMCMRCIYNCPTQAISPRFSKFVPIKGGYKLDDYV